MPGSPEVAARRWPGASSSSASTRATGSSSSVMPWSPYKRHARPAPPASVHPMDVRSLGFRTDLMLRRLADATVEDRGDHAVVTTAANPGFWWGNFLLLAEPPRDIGPWVAAFQR